MYVPFEHTIHHINVFYHITPFQLTYIKVFAEINNNNK